MAITFLLHGFNVRDKGVDTVNKLIPYLEVENRGQIIKHSYGWFGLLSVLFKNKKIAKRLKREKDMLCGNSLAYAVGHSNGCAIIVESARRGTNYDTILLINPALKTYTEFPPNIKKIVVVHTNHDIATLTARFLDKVPFVQLAIPNAWGAMGSKGYIGEDKRVVNFDFTSSLDGHSDIFEDDKLNVHGETLCKLLYGHHKFE